MPLWKDGADEFPHLILHHAFFQQFIVTMTFTNVSETDTAFLAVV